MALAAAAFFGVYLMATERVRTTTTTLSFLRLAIVSSTVILFLFNLAAGISMQVPSHKSWAARKASAAWSSSVRGGRHSANSNA